MNFLQENWNCCSATITTATLQLDCKNHDRCSNLNNNFNNNISCLVKKRPKLHGQVADHFCMPAPYPHNSDSMIIKAQACRSQNSESSRMMFDCQAGIGCKGWEVLCSSCSNLAADGWVGLTHRIKMANETTKKGFMWFSTGSHKTMVTILCELTAAGEHLPQSTVCRDPSNRPKAVICHLPL